jgi:hypothetical protein
MGSQLFFNSFCKSDTETLCYEYSDNNRKNLCSNKLSIMGIIERSPTNVVELPCFNKLFIHKLKIIFIVSVTNIRIFL